ncbi:MAG: hypothetical protein A3F74_17495 [Betaproteobacteria bacterium RIFCSPLOWO2_12_FULL_62_58]|nr:MAG: hypothetical protein A3F74_17495 [Betaproteobacteria bacterium RIFCSPLOWO2_12_FULL_62_58]
MSDTSIERGQAALDALAAGEMIQDVVKRLALLDCLEYEKLRDTEAQRLGVRVGVLDKEVSKARHTAMDESGKATIFPAVEPWPEPVDGAALLTELLATLQRYIVCARDTAVAVSLWCAFTWLIDRVQVAPLAVITAPEKRCGKTQLLNFIGKVCHRPLVASNISPAAVFRVIEAHNPTLLIDEADSFLKENEELRGVINSGHTRQSAYVIRTVGDDHEPRQFSTWGAKAISSIGHLAETIVDRAIVLELRRKLPTESVQRLRHAEPQLFERLASKLARFADDAGRSIERARPNLPYALNDRAQDNWEPLLAIADHIGGDWPDIARRTALRISGAEREAQSLSTELLVDIRNVFDGKQVPRIKTADLLMALAEDENRPWATYNRGKPMVATQLAKRLAEYGIKPSTMRIDGPAAKGYSRADFDDTFRRYLSPCADTPSAPVAPLQIAKSVILSNTPSVTESHACGDIENPSVTPNLLIDNDCYGATAKTGEAARNAVEIEI